MLEVEFAGRNLENSAAYATWEHPVDSLEPIEQEESNEAAEVIRALMGEIFRTRKQSKPVSIMTAMRRFTALVWLARPDLLGSRSQTEIAVEMGTTRAGFSKLVVAFSDRFGFSNPGMKTKTARESYRGVQLGHVSYKIKGQCQRAKPVGTHKVSASTLESEERRLLAMREQFHAGQTWRKPDRQLARRRGLVDEGEMLTAKGKEWVGVPTLGSPQNRQLIGGDAPRRRNL